MKLAHLAEGRFNIIRSLLSLYINSITNDDYVTSYAAVCCPMTCLLGLSDNIVGTWKIICFALNILFTAKLIGQTKD